LIALASAQEGDTGFLSATELHELLSRFADRKYKATYKTTNKLSRSMTTHLSNGAFSRAGLDVEKKSSGKNNRFRILDPTFFPDAHDPDE
jgi:hypothetical protein